MKRGSEPLNLCRQFLLAARRAEKSGRLISNDRGLLKMALDAAAMKSCQKFALPDEGVLLPDEELRGLQGHVVCRLPFPMVALEFESGTPRGSAPTDDERFFIKAGLMAPDTKGKIIIFALDTDEIAPGIARLIHGESYGRDFGEIGLIQCGFTEFLNGDMVVVVSAASLFKHQEIASEAGHARFAFARHVDSSASAAVQTYAACRVMMFLNALACSNVHIEKQAPRKPNKRAKNALPFDTYHVLTIDVPRKSGAVDPRGGSHASPREHLRRGHIRRLDDDRRIWVNSCVVSAGRGFGKVDKDYRVRSGEHRC